MRITTLLAAGAMVWAAGVIAASSPGAQQAPIEAVTAAARSEKNRVLNCYMVHVMKQPPHPFCADFDFRTPK